MVDVFIIGGGPGGYVAAIKAAQLGLSVSLAEQADMGGVCTNWGCIPTKTMLASSKLLTRMQEARKFGLTAESVGADFGAIMARKDQVVVRLRKGIEYLMKKNHVQVYASRATLRDATHVCIDATGEVIQGKNVIIATGSSPIKFPPFTDPGIWTSDDVFRNREQPKELVVIGGGVIGVEMATFFGAIGTKVTIVELMPHILPVEDEDVAQALTATLKKRGITIITGATTQSVIPTEGGYALTLDVNGTRQELHGDRVLLSIGRRSNVGPELEAAGITVSKKGIVVDDHMRTSVPGVYAVGDVKGAYMLAHVAEKEGVVAAENIAGHNARMVYTAIPSVVFTDPEISVVGKREYELKAEGIPYKVGTFPVTASGKARTMEENTGFAKVLAHAETHEILGIALYCAEATDLVMESVLAVQFGMTAEKLLQAIHPHPTMTEMVMEATEGSIGLPLQL
ncbi:MAG: dihydrolipoyl dehydrogenase [Caldiserica bacterium]|nr:dihydrolipoyl dehydrogenase [Caldisericota bacterium]